MLGGLERELDAPTAGLGHRAELAGADFDEGKLGRDEEPVGGHEAEDQEDFESDTQ
jgi:hypothetical protein